MSEHKNPQKTPASWPEVVATLEALPSAAAVTSGEDGARVRVNRRFAELFGEAGAQEEMARADYEALVLSRIAPVDREQAASILQRLREDPRATVIANLHLTAPENARISVWSVPVEDSEGAVTGRLTLHREIGSRTLGDVGGEEEPGSELEQAHRELENAQAALLRSEKMATLGQLVAGVAHEINTPVGSIHSNGDLMVKAVDRLRDLLSSKGELSESPELARTVEVLDDIGRVNRTACERIVELVRSLRNFARGEEAERHRVDIHEGLESTLTLVHHELKNRIEVVRDYSELPPVECFPSQLNQVFMNLFVNASQAIPDKGVIRIRTRCVGDRARIEISDDGIGIPPENLDRVFEPGFTTKKVGEGTGIGLAICSRIVEAHGGEIDVRSAPGRGTTFNISLPVGASPGPVLPSQGEAGSGEPEAPSISAPESSTER